MAQPPAYNRLVSFTNLESADPSGQPPGSDLDGEFNLIKQTLDAVLTNLALIQRDDGEVANATIGTDQLSTELSVGINTWTVWVTSTVYAVNATVFHGSGVYRCLIAHTAGVFATDLSALKWVLVLDFSTLTLGAASGIANTPAGNISSTDVQSALNELDSEKAATSHTHPSSAITDSTAAGRAMLSAASVAAQQALLGLGSLAYLSTVPVTAINAQISFTGIITPAALNADTNDWTPTGIATCAIVRMSASADINLTGLVAAAVDGTVVTLENVGTVGVIKLVPSSASSAAANRFLIAKTVLVGPNSSVVLKYDLTSARWRQMTFNVGSLPRGHIDGLTLSQSSTTVLAIAAGKCRDATDIADIFLTAFTKTTSAWVAGTGNGGLDTGAIASSTWYYAFTILKSADGTTDALFSTSFSSPTMPTGYDRKRYIGAFKTDGSSHVPVITQKGGEFFYAVMVNDLSTTVGDTTAHSLALTVPPSAGVRARISITSTNQTYIAVTDLSTTDTAASATFNTVNAGSGGGGGMADVWCNTSGQVRYRMGSISCTLAINTLGYFDPRGTNA